MSKEKDFKSITVPFKKSNEDVKEKIMDLCDETGKSKIDLVCDAIRQYNPNKDNNEFNKIDREEIEKIVKEILGGMLLNNMALNVTPYPNNIQQQITTKTKEELEKEKLKQLNDKTVDLSLVDDD
ncbi:MULTISPECIES: hypothetical protein [Clostridium]|uniref:hypothetical protein n=1 Tax=Clostridium TaxID=1485 RepID=UPI00024BA45C|nr:MULTISPECIES: hypothetical protein [Clostridium]EHN17001.1 hypothetical protein IYC_00447 [Clostridium sporogenes PA 3679]MBY6798162.1 hypothetical protein [Clostridium botulinum]MBY6867864.1 hypothetical protein [Clostridium botulinum]NFI47958.1 hypothetical protein [Clostridium botulinum]NFJ91995.1 hypothetical protein [Clostridium botulinum]